jgi:hypothetical protein
MPGIPTLMLLETAETVPKLKVLGIERLSGNFSH